MSEVLSIKVPLHDKQREIAAYALVSPEDFENVNKYTWSRRVVKKTNKIYAVGWVNVNGKKIYLDMHHFINGKPPKGMKTDHKNRVTLDNTRDNLHNVTNSQNGQNADRKGRSTKGISYNKRTKKWSAMSQRHNLGSYTTKEEAMLAYDKYAFRVFGKDAKTNGTTSYEECKDLDITTLIKEKKKVHPNICKTKRGYRVKIQYNKKIYEAYYYKTIEEAVIELDKIILQVNKVKEQELEDHNKKPISRNEKGDAIIQVGDKEFSVDDDLWHKLTVYSWSNADPYACTTINGVQEKMHHFVMKIRGVDLSNIGLGDGKDVIDHIDKNTRNTKTENLRINDVSGNRHNRRKKADASSDYVGVCYNKNNGKWLAKVCKNYECFYVGEYTTEEEAAIAHDIKAKDLYGNKANLNNIDNPELHIKIKTSLDKKHGASRFYGVTYNKARSKWVASITKGKTYTLGYFDTEEKAALAYNEKAIELRGPNWKKLNKVDVPK